MAEPPQHSPLPDSAQVWQLADVIDFEYLLQADPPAKPDASTLHRIRSSGLGAQPDRRQLFRLWLAHQREKPDTRQPLPGTLLCAAWSMVVKLLALLGALAGVLATAQLLHYDGVQPVNVAAYLGWLVGFQIALAFVAVVVVLLRRTRWLSTESSILISLLGGIWMRFADWLLGRVRSRLTGEQRDRYAAFMGSVQRHRTIYPDLHLWPMTGALQIFGITFNVAACLTTIALVIFSDRAFGWQSAVNFSPEQVHAVTQMLAMPWSWAWPDASPTLQQIAGSKIVLKDGIKQLSTTNLVSWWPFLCLALVTYGLLPRVVLWLSTWAAARRSLRRLSFSHADCDRLYQQLVGPRLQTSGVGGEQQHSTTGLSGGDSRTGTGSSPIPTGMTAALALVGPDVKRFLNTTEFEELIKQRFLVEIRQTVSWSGLAKDLENTLQEAGQVGWTDQQPTVVLLDEAWQPPIAEKLESIRELRHRLGVAARILVVLIGRPEGDIILTRPAATDLSVWTRQIRALGDPHIRVEAWLDHD